MNENIKNIPGEEEEYQFPQGEFVQGESTGKPVTGADSQEIEATIASTDKIHAIVIANNASLSLSASPLSLSLSFRV